MATSRDMHQRVSFHGYQFDGETGRLWLGTQEIRLTPKASAVLNELIAHAGRPVSKEQLFSVVWSGTAVSDDALTSCIQELRRVLQDDARQPRFIETRHRRGYRFIAEVSAAAPAQSRSAAEAPPPAGAVSAIAVLPFADMSPGRDHDYLCEGLAEELINALTQIDGLRVAARTASFQFRASGGDLRAIGQRLRVETLLEGSVRRADDRLRVTVQLIDIETGFHRWSQRFDCRLDDVFAMQDEIAARVVASLRGNELTSRERQALVRPQTGAEAYEYYLRGRQYLPRMAASDLEKSGQMFERAIELDPAYGPAHAGLATVHATLYEWFGAKSNDLVKAEQSSDLALELAPGLAEAHVACGFTLSLSRRYDDAAREFAEAIRLNPHLFEAYYYYARTSFARGDIQGSADLFAKAAEVRQEDFQSPMLLGQSLRMLGRIREGYDASLEGIERAERVLALNPVDSRALSLGAVHHLEIGQPARAMEWIRRALELYPDDLSTLVSAACLHARLGLKDEALGFLGRVFARGWGNRDWMAHDPDYESLRGDPRFEALLTKLK